jgi:hypothetical protein
MIADLEPASSLIDDQCEAIELCKVGLSLLSRAPDQRLDIWGAARLPGATGPRPSKDRPARETAPKPPLKSLCALCDSVVARSFSVIIII